MRDPPLAVGLRPMHRTLRLLLAVPVCALALPGCIPTRSFLDPAAAPVAYSEIRKAAAPLRLRVSVVFQRNGAPVAEGNPALLAHTLQALERSGAILGVAAGGDGEMSIVMNHLVDTADSLGRGFFTGLTMGLAATTVVEQYEASATVTMRGRTYRASARQALHTSIGFGDVPAGARVLPKDGEFPPVIEQVTLRLLRDLQRSMP